MCLKQQQTPHPTPYRPPVFRPTPDIARSPCTAYSDAVRIQVADTVVGHYWQRADVIFVSDGEWPAPTSVLRAVEKAREAGTRFHGVQIGNRGQTGLHAVCEPVHLFHDWASAGGWR